MARPGTVDRVSAAVAATGAVVVGGWFVVTGVQIEMVGAPGRGPLDRAFPFLLAATAVAVFGLMAWRSWRAADRADAAAPPAEAPVVLPTPLPGAPTTPAPPVAVRVVPDLSAEGRDRLAHTVAVLERAGVLPSGVVEPDALAGGVADHGEPVTTGAVLGALGEAGPDGWDALLALLSTWAEQDPAEHAAALDRLAGPDHRVAVAGASVEVDGTAVAVVTPGHPKALDPGPLAAAARALRDRGAPRIAWLWTDQLLWLATPSVSPAELNDLLDQPVYELWEWADEARA
ncbi:hypothetical protein [Pseudonocardia alni]|uniref:hypothetical protein n=1 Tax=Pseudonocardia alni TaxID=33907 RepID=UPI0015B92537|nr:hypothetical protein [Pseudonocardia alni]NWJ73441.1 hypothetical protein [Pseudonocardia pini]